MYLLRRVLNWGDAAFPGKVILAFDQFGRKIEHWANNQVLMFQRVSYFIEINNM